MEYTPNYLVVESAAESISRLVTESRKLKFIVMLRDPVKRVESSWKFKKSFCRACSNHIDKSIPSFLLSIGRGMNQGRCISTCYDNYLQMKKNRTLPTHAKFKDFCSILECRLRHDDKSGSSGGRSHLAHVVKSMYAYQLIIWYEFFHPSQFHIFTLESYIKCPFCEIEKILQFFGLATFDHKDKNSQPGFPDKGTLDRILKTKLNATPKIEEVEAEVTPETLQNLTKFFVPHNILLQGVLGWSPGYTDSWN